MSQVLEDLRRQAEAAFAAERGSPATVAIPTVVASEYDPGEDDELTPPTPDSPAIDSPIEPIQPEVSAQPDEPAQPLRTKRIVYRQVVDSKVEGVQPQVFKAATKDELIGELVKAQENATRAIVSLKKQNKDLLQKVQPDPAQPAKLHQPRTLTAEEELDLATEMQSSPTAAITKAIEATFGASLADIRNDLAYGRESRQKEAIRETGQRFIASHPEYPISAKNEQLMAKYIKDNSLAWTEKNLELAFTDLVDAQLIAPKGTEEPVNPSAVPAALTEEEEEVESAAAPVVAAPVVPAAAVPVSEPVQRRRKAVVGISSRQVAAATEPEQPREASVEDFLKISPEERKRIVRAQFNGGQTR